MSTESEVIISADSVAQITCPACGAVFSGEGISPFSSVMCASCEKEFAAPGSFGSFLLLECLGMGGMGGVFRARDLSLNRDVAVKVMQASLGSDPHFIETFRREAQSVAKLNHPNIAQIYAFGEEKGQPYLVMELVKGTSLSKMMEAGPVEPAVAVKIGEQIAQALKHASESNIVHGDVKPENILLDENKQAKLVDFGIAALSGAREGGNEVWGTPYYIAPEKVTRQKVDRRADMYSLGGTLFHALTGQPPFDGPDPIAVIRARLDKPAPQLKELIPSIDSDLNAVVDRMLKLDPAQRYPTYDSLLADLGSVLKKLRPAAFEGKKFVIKGKRPPAPAMTTSPAVAVVEEPVVGEKKRKGLFLSKRGDQSEDIAALSGTEADAIAAPLEPVDEEEAARQRKITVIKYAVLGVAGFFILIGIIIGIVAGVKSSKEKGAVAAAEAKRLEQIQAAEIRIANVMTQARKIHEKVHGYAVMADEQTREVLVAAEKVTPEAYKIVLKPEIPPRKGYEAPVEQKVETPPPVAAVSTNVAVSAVTNSPVVAVTNTPVASATNAPAVTAVNSPAPVVAATNPPPAAPATVKPPEEPVAAVLPENTPPGLLMVRELVLQTAYLNGVAKDTQAWLAWLEMASVSVGEMRGSLEKMNALAEKMIMEYNRFASEKDVLTSKSLADQIRRAVLKCKGEIEVLDRTFKAQAEAKLKAEKAGSAAEAKAKAEAEQQTLAKQEVERVTVTEASVQEEIKAFRLASVRRQLNALSDEFRTPAGKAACEEVQTKLRYIEAFQNHLIKKLPGFSGIQSADNRRIVLEGGRDMKWDDIIAKYPQQMVRFIVAFVVEEKALGEYKATERGRIALGAAIYLEKSIKGSVAVDKIARELADRTIRKIPAMEEEVRKLAAPVLQTGEAASAK